MQLQLQLQLHVSKTKLGCGVASVPLPCLRTLPLRLVNVNECLSALLLLRLICCVFDCLAIFVGLSRFRVARLPSGPFRRASPGVNGYAGPVRAGVLVAPSLGTREVSADYHHMTDMTTPFAGRDRGSGKPVPGSFSVSKHGIGFDWATSL